jgi:hypothetical protein
MYHALVFYPWVSDEWSRSIDAMRCAYDPTCDLIKPHVSVVFPVPDSIEQGDLVNHIQDVLGTWGPFRVGFGSLHKSADHWLFLTLTEGESEVKRLYQDLHTGILAPYRRWGADFLPHVGLGLFRSGRMASDSRGAARPGLDRDRYERALSQAEGLPLAGRATVGALQMVEIPEAIVEWVHGKRAWPGDGLRIVDVHEFRLDTARA